MAGILIVSILFLWIALDFSIARFLIALILVSAPFYYFLGRFEMEIMEKIIFSLFLSIGIIPTIVYPLTLIIGSLRVTIVLVFIILLGSLFFLRKK